MRRQQVLVCSRSHFTRLIIFLVALGVLLAYIGTQRSEPGLTPVQTADTGNPAVEPLGLPVFTLQPAEEVDYFIDSRLERDSARQLQLDLLRELINNPNSGEDARREADQRFLGIVDQLGKEMEIEGLIRAKGFTDALVLLNAHMATAIIDAPQLDPVDVTRIADIIVRTTGLPPTAISVVAYRQ